MDKLEFRKKLEERTKKFSIDMIMFLKSFPYSNIDQVIGKQVLRSSTSVGANYREANRAESKKDFIHKIGIVEKEISETYYWLELIEATWQMENTQEVNFTNLKKESHELLLLFSSISRNCKK